MKKKPLPPKRELRRIMVEMGRRGGAKLSGKGTKGFATMDQTRARELRAAALAARGIPTACAVCGEMCASIRSAKDHCKNSIASVTAT
jgi:hypothetical protein